ncbi:MAG: polysaccharide biosynthesis/export family protein [Chthoniobacterales bacterium]|nr:polysaccharide biosynthesis/export family protein [Chthoniobacterales bacterium]MCX7712401.1 polysaccharide biosynthesis/export family protein [Chthoniobacterales bacterium]
MTSAKQFASERTVQAESAKLDNRYRIVPSDVYSFLVRGCPDATENNVIISPDGNASLPRIGIIHVQDMTVEKLTNLARDKLSSFYENPEVTIIMREHNSNRVFFL